MNVRNLIKLFSVVAAVVSISITATAQEDKKDVAKDASPAGTWEWDRESATGQVHCVLSLKEKGGKLEGNFSDADGLKAKVEKGTFKDGKVELQLKIDADGQEFEVMLAGTLKGDKIDGKITVQMGDDTEEIDWAPKRTMPLADAVGKWRMYFTTPDGQEMEPEFELKDKDGKPTINFLEGGNLDRDSMDISKVKYKNGNLTFTMEMDYEGMEIKVDYDLNLSDKAKEGVLYFEFAENGESGELDIELTRIK